MTSINAVSETILVKPQLTLFVFHLCKELTQEKTADAEEIWVRLGEVGKHLNIGELEQLRQRIESAREQQKGDRPRSLQEKAQNLLPGDGVISIANAAIDSNLLFTGGIYPIKLHDTYGVDLTLKAQSDRVTVSELSKLNPQSCFSPSHIRPSLGQTLLLFAEVTGLTSNFKATAQEIIQRFYSTNQPLLIGEGKFLGGTIYQFEDDLLDAPQRQHFWVWLATDQLTPNLEAKGDYYHPLLNLLCCRHKAQLVYYKARSAYKESRKLYSEIEPIVTEFTQLKAAQDGTLREQLQTLERKTRNRRLSQQVKGLLSDQGSELGLVNRLESQLEQVADKRLEGLLRELQQERLRALEKWLFQIPQKTTDYARCLRDLQVSLTTIATNTRNYKSQLNRLKEISLPQDNLAFLEEFLGDCDRFQEQVRYDLDYLTSGQALFDQLIESIRGLVEIEAQKQQIVRDLAEKERDRSIEVWITVVGSGLAVSGLTSAIMPEPVQALFTHFQLSQYQQMWYGSPASLLVLNVLFHSTAGILSAILVAIVARGAIERFLRFLGNRIRIR